MSAIIRRIEQLFCLCSSKYLLIRVSGKRMYTECTKCGATSKGVEYGRKAA